MNDENVTGQQNNVRTDSTSLNPDSLDFTPSMLRHPFSTPPPNFNAAPPQAGNHEAMYQFQAEQNKLQAQNYKDMMMFIQQQNLEMQQKHQQTLLKQQEQNDERVRQQNLEMRQQHQESLRMQQDQNETRMNQLMETLKLNKSETKVKCPKWEKEENVKNFINRLKRWNDVEKGKGKYLQLLESLQESDRKKEKQRIELEEQNGDLKPENEDIILKIVEKLEKWFGKTKIDEASDSWESFIDLKRTNDEKLDDFLLRFETAESKLRIKGIGAGIPDRFMFDNGGDFKNPDVLD